MLFHKNPSLTIILKNDTETNWESKNPILQESEVIVVRQPSNLAYKLGDGITHYKDLPFSDLEYCLEHGYMYVKGNTAFNIQKIKICLTRPEG
jgi:hypothetical protein